MGKIRMDAASSAQISMQDYFATPKSRKIACLILAATLAVMFGGAVFAAQQPAVEPVQMAHALSSDELSALASSYSVTGTEYTDYFGAYYLDEGTNPGNAAFALFIAGATFAGLILLFFVAISASVQSHYKKSDERLYALGKTDDAEFEFTAMDNLRFEKSKLVLSEHFAYSGSTGNIAVYEDILWLYKRVRRNHGVVVSTQLIAGLITGRSVALASRFITDELIEQSVTKVLRQNPNVLVGYSFDYARQYRAKVKEFKQTIR